MNNVIIGVDFDNTIADYDELMYKLALEARFIHGDIGAEKQKIRDHIRSLDEGEIKWQKIQAMAYGRFMPQARLIEGVADFFTCCRQRKVPVFIVSHKTQFASRDEERHDLHRAALGWMKEKRLFQEGHVFFEPDRQKKIERIKALGCTYFIDDLEEVFLDKAFPEGVRKILYASHGKTNNNKNVLAMSSWKMIYDYFFTDIGK